MTAHIKDSEFTKNQSPELIKALKEKIRDLKEPDTATNVILKLIDEAESLLDSNPSAAQKAYDEAKGKIENIAISNAAKPLAWRLFWIEIGYLVFLLLLGYFTFKWPSFFLWDGLINMSLQTVWFGALGGVTIAIYGIYEHMQLRDFDPKFELWYICKPIIGGIFGWFIYLIYYIGLISVQGIEVSSPKHPELAYAIAFLAGFSERFTLKLIDKLMGVLTTWEEKPQDKSSKKQTT